MTLQDPDLVVETPGAELIVGVTILPRGIAGKWHLSEGDVIQCVFSLEEKLSPAWGVCDAGSATVEDASGRIGAWAHFAMVGGSGGGEWPISPIAATLAELGPRRGDSSVMSVDVMFLPAPIDLPETAGRYADEWRAHVGMVQILPVYAQLPTFHRLIAPLCTEPPDGWDAQLSHGSQLTNRLSYGPFLGLGSEVLQLVPVRPEPSGRPAFDLLVLRVISCVRSLARSGEQSSIVVSAS